MTHVSKIDVLVLIRLQVWSFNKCFLVVIVGHENTGVVGGTVSAMALLYCRSVKLLSTIPVCCVCVCVCVCLGILGGGNNKKWAVAGYASITLSYQNQ